MPRIAYDNGIAHRVPEDDTAHVLTESDCGVIFSTDKVRRGDPGMRCCATCEWPELE